jgi:hypothetical protein
VTDETVAIDRATGCVDPYPKPIALEIGSLVHFPELVPDGYANDGPLGKWWVPASALRGGAATTSPSRPAAVVFPAYRPGGETTLHPLSRAQAAVMLAENSFNFRASGPGALALVGRVVAGCDCYRLDAADVETACAAIEQVLERRVTG